MIPIVLLSILLLYLPFRLSRGFVPVQRITISLIVAVKTVVLVMLHFHIVNTTGHPIILDASIDAKKYYDVGEAFAGYRLTEITRADVESERGASSHLGYYYCNIWAFHVSPNHPILFLRMAKLLIFHIALGLLASTWRQSSNSNRAFWGYVVLGLVFYQIFYYTFRNTKDDIVLSLFMIIMAIADRTVAAARDETRQLSMRKAVVHWAIIGAMVWALAEIRYYVALAIVCAFALHFLTGRAIKPVYRAVLGLAVASGFVIVVRTSGFNLVEEEGGVFAVTGALTNIYGLFKVFVTPVPWQHDPMLGVPHTFYLFMLPIALWAFFARFRSNLDWKLYVVMAVALVVGGHMQNFNPRKRYIMYPVFMGWIVTADRRRRESAAQLHTLDASDYSNRLRHSYG